MKHSKRIEELCGWAVVYDESGGGETRLRSRLEGSEAESLWRWLEVSREWRAYGVLLSFSQFQRFEFLDGADRERAVAWPVDSPDYRCIILTGFDYDSLAVR